MFEGAYRVAGPGWEPGGAWYRGVRWREEAARGLGDREDVWAAGTFGAALEPGDELEVTAAAAPFDAELPPAGVIVQGREPARRRRARRARATGPVAQQLVLAADQFVISTPTGRRRLPATRGSASGRATR